MKLLWAGGAQRDLERIERHISRDNRIAAFKTISQIQRAVEILKRYPRIGRRGRVPGTRELVIAHLPYVVAYKCHSETIEVIPVLHGATRRPAKF